MTKRWRKFADNNGFTGVRLHDLRHSSAMIMVESGVDINTIKKQLFSAPKQRKSAKPNGLTDFYGGESGI